MTDPQTPAPRKSRRLLKGGCGCGAFLLGALVVLGLLLPRILGGLLGGRLEEEFDARFEGSLEVPALALGWSERQSVSGIELLDPEGVPVFTASLECPSLVDLLEAASAVEGGGPIALGVFRVELEGEVRVDEEGRSNLDAALSESGATVTVSSTGSGGGGGSGGGDAEALELLERVELQVEFVAPELRWTDPRIDVPGHTAALHDVEGVLTLDGGDLRLIINGEQECQTRGGFWLDVQAGDFRTTEGETQPGSLRADLIAGGLSAALVDRLAELDGEASALLGDQFELQMGLKGDPSASSDWSAELSSESSRVALSGVLSEQRFELSPGGAEFEIDPALAAERVRVWSERALPPGTRIEVPSGELAVTLGALELSTETEAAGPESLRLHAALDLGPFSVIDPLANGSGERLDLDGLALSLRIDPGAPLVAQLTTAFVEAAGSRLSLELELDEDWSVAAAEEREEDITGSLRLRATELPLDRARKLAGIEDRLEDLVGGRMALEVDARLAQQELQRIELGARSEQLDLSAKVGLAGGRVVIEEGGLVAAARVSKVALADTLRELLPPGYVLTSRDPELALGLEVSRLELDLAQLEGEQPWAGAALDLAVTTGAIDYTDSVLGPAGAQIALSSSELRLSLDEGGALGLQLGATPNGAAGGALDVKVQTGEGAALLAGEDPGSTRFEVTGTLRGFPTRVIDLYTEQEGLLVDVLGPTVDASLASPGLTQAGGPLQLEASSKLGSFSWRGSYLVDEAGLATLDSGEGGELKAAVGLSPLLGERIVGPLVPLLVDLKKPDTAPVGFSATQVRLPLDGDLRGLDAKLRLDLGQVTCSFLPALARDLPGFSTKAVQSTDIEPLDLEIVQGVVRYDRLPLKIDGRPFELMGSYDLVSGALDLSTDVRLGDLGGEAGKLLKDVRKVLGDSYVVPIQIGGTPKAPKLGLKPGFLEATLKDVGQQKLEDELSRGLRKLFGD